MGGEKRVKDLKANPKNPRRVTEAKLSQLEKSMREFGDISGIFYNVNTGNIGGGTQRTSRFDANSKIVITKKLDKPSRAGTVAYGYVLLDGERFSYREVAWSKAKETAANLAANKQAGEWDRELLGEALSELASFDVDFDLDLTMFDEVERKQFEPVEEFIAEEHWTEAYEGPEVIPRIIVMVDEDKMQKFVKLIGVKKVKRSASRKVWSLHWPEEK